MKNFPFHYKFFINAFSVIAACFITASILTALPPLSVEMQGGILMFFILFGIPTAFYFSHKSGYMATASKTHNYSNRPQWTASMLSYGLCASFLATITAFVGIEFFTIILISGLSGYYIPEVIYKMKK